MDELEYVSMTVFCNNCKRTFMAPIKDSIDSSIENLSKCGCIYCGKEAESKQLQIMSFEREQFDAQLTELYANLCKYVTFD